MDQDGIDSSAPGGKDGPPLLPPPPSAPAPPLPPPPSPANCPSCGSEVAPSSAYCRACGASVSAPDASLRSRNSLWVALAAITIVVMALGAVGGRWLIMSSLDRQTITGSMTLIDSDFFGRSVGASCSGTGGYSDIKAGANVKLSDGKGNIIATSQLNAGTIERSQRCLFTFSLDDVPDEDFYVIGVGGGRRGELTYSKSEMQDMDWTIDLVIGD